jgi:alkyl hydroperoxide reductase subunit F
MKVYDLIILGAGPAGITAAIYAARKKLDFLVITLDIGGQAAWSGDIENYTGYQFITGPDLALKFQEHMDAFGITVKIPERAVDIYREGKLIKINTDLAEYCTKTAIIATGKRPRPLSVPGETEFKNKGVTYCAICDGPIYKGKNVLVVGGGNSALDAAIQLAKICPLVHVVNMTEALTADRVMVEAINNLPNATVHNNTMVKAIYGESFVTGVVLKKHGKEEDLKVEGVFIEIGLIPNSNFVSRLQTNKNNEIVVDCNNNTSIPGIFSAGDVTNVAEKQIIIACGEGSKACLAADSYLVRGKW